MNSEECEVVSSSGVRFSRAVLNHSSADASIGVLCSETPEMSARKRRGAEGVSINKVYGIFAR